MKEALIFQHFLDFLIPPRCLMCRQVVVSAERVCGDCFKELEFIEKPCCYLCARPFISQEAAGKDHICLECSELTVLWHQCRAAFLYNDGFKKLIMPLKYADQQNSLSFLSHFMYRCAQDIFSQTDFIIPVPLHKKRLRYRKYNQSALLAWDIGGKSKNKVLPMGLLRVKETEVLGHFNKEERQLLLKNAFAVTPGNHKRLRNKNILLVDDVMTTGSTLEACTSTLMQAGVARVNVLVAAKTVSLSVK